MKKILLTLLIVITSAAANAQATCAGATVISASGTFVCPAITGTYPTGTGICYAAPTTTPHAIWYKFTPTNSGLISIDADIAANPIGTTDTRLSVLSGTCAAYTCVDANDDFSTTDYRSQLLNVAVTAGTTYFIVWDNNWSATGFTFNFTFTAATCFAPTAFSFTAAPTTTTAGIGWTAPTQGSPIGYQFEYGPQGFTQGTGTTLTPTSTSVSLTGLTASSVYSFYIRTDCDLSDFSTWTGPITFNTVFQPATPPYNTSFENTSLGYLGWATSVTGTNDDWFLNNGGAASPLVQNGAVSVVSFANATAVSTSRLYSRGINLIAGQTSTITYYVRNYLATGSTGTASYKLTVGTAQTAVAQTTILATETGLANTTFALKTYTFIPTTSGVYYFGFLDNSPINAGTQALILDNFTVTQALATTDFLSGKFSVSPNPANDVITISNANDILVNGITLTDLNGRMVKSAKYDNLSNVQINVSDLSSGVYMMNITSKEGTATKKIIKN